MSSPRARRLLVRGVSHLFLFAIALTAFYPFFVMIISSTHNHFNIMTTINILPGNSLGDNWERLTRHINIFRGTANSLVIAISATILQNYFTLMGGYAFSKFLFKGRSGMFAFVVIMMMIPGQISIIGFFHTVRQMGLINSYIPLIIPGIANSFAVFFYKQYLDGALPNEMIEAAVMDGCREINIFHQIVLPLAKPALVVQGVLIFIGSWNSYLTPLIILNDRDRMTLPLLIATVRDANHAEVGAQYLGMLISIIPIVIIFCFSSKVIMERISIGAAVKG
ncbi:MAG: carbohydrate ABC transporter permease [Defluviitaleaceae bacterium]|nr:carbohydrate ABC transporter permease [Defluviitaleaceae bacterium]